jgi:putative methyltransferase (TIGR04325 family)
MIENLKKLAAGLFPRAVKSGLNEIHDRPLVTPTIPPPAHEEWTGPFVSWTEAAEKATGYDSPLILDKVLQAAIKVKTGQAAYERDSVTFDRIQYAWPVTAALLYVALQNGRRLNVLDFGGSLGTSYFQNRKMLSGVSPLNWCVVEQPHFVAAGTKYLASSELKFFLTANEAVQVCEPDVILVSGVLQVIENAYQVMEDLFGRKVPFVLIDRLSVLAGTTDEIYLQQVPPSIYEASYSNHFFGEQNIMKQIETNYLIISDFKSDCDPSLILSSDKIVHWKGYFCVKKK